MVYEDLTQGSIFGRLAKYSVPLILSGLLQALYALTDMMVAGHFLGASAISAISNSGQIMDMITNVLMGLTTGGGILIGQYFGAKDRENLKACSVTILTSAGILGVFLSVLFIFISKPLLILLKAPALEEATGYLRICSFGIIFISGYNACSSILRGAGNSSAPLICVAVSASLNVALDIIFVSVLGRGVAGTAEATVISQAVSFALSFVFILRDKVLFGITLKKLRIHRDKLIRIIKIGIPVSIQMSIASVSWLSVTFLLNSYGIAVSAGSGVAIKIKSLCQLFISAMVNGSTGMISQCIGAKLYSRARTVMYTAMRITLTIAVITIVIVQLFAPAFVSLFTSDQEAALAAVKNLRIEIIGQIFYASFLIYHSLALGAGHTWFVMISSFTNCILARLILAVILNRVLGVTGVYIACMAAPFTSVPLGLWYERSNRWRREPAR